MYSSIQKRLIIYSRAKVKDLFTEYPVKAHGFDHAQRVSKWAVIIAKAEKANIFLSEISAVLHDIGRVTEEFPGNTKSHHELSYEMCQEWFREDKEFSVLSKTEKLQILYAVRYHWNNAADKTKLSWILRDADKLDALGKIGLSRGLEFFAGDEKAIDQDLRFKADMVINIRSRLARRIIKQKKLFEPLQKYHIKLLKRKIKPVRL